MTNEEIRKMIKYMVDRIEDWKKLQCIYTVAKNL